MTRMNWVTTCTTALLALTMSTAVAGQRAGPRDDRGRESAPAQRKFNDNDRQATLSWYNTHQRSLPMGFRASDRFSPAVEGQFQDGYVIDRKMRGQAHSLPSTLLRLLAPAPRGYRYVAIGDQLVLIDSGYRVYDVIRVGHDR